MRLELRRWRTSPSFKMYKAQVVTTLRTPGPKYPLARCSPSYTKSHSCTKSNGSWTSKHNNQKSVSEVKDAARQLALPKIASFRNGVGHGNEFGHWLGMGVQCNNMPNWHYVPGVYFFREECASCIDNSLSMSRKKGFLVQDTHKLEFIIHLLQEYLRDYSLQNICNVVWFLIIKNDIPFKMGFKKPDI